MVLAIKHDLTHASVHPVYPFMARLSGFHILIICEGDFKGNF